jgi:hypothetical protein
MGRLHPTLKSEAEKLFDSSRDNTVGKQVDWRASISDAVQRVNVRYRDAEGSESVVYKLHWPAGSQADRSMD